MTSEVNDQIRPYGPGKFSTIVDQYVYQVSLDGGCDDETSNEGSGEWAGVMVNGSTIFQDHDPNLESLNDAERELITSSAGVILYQDSNGFVSVEYFGDRKQLDDDWAHMLENFNTDDQDQEF